MFDVSLVELAVIALVALLVLGPERLPRAARTVGLYVRKARQSWYGVRADIERELAADELKRSLKKSGDDMRQSIGLDGLREELRGMHDDVTGRRRISPPRERATGAPNELPPEQNEYHAQVDAAFAAVEGTAPPAGDARGSNAGTDGSDAGEVRVIPLAHAPIETAAAVKSQVDPAPAPPRIP